MVNFSAGEKARKRGIHPGFETQGRCHQKSKTGVSVAPQKGLVSSKFKKKVFMVNVKDNSFLNRNLISLCKDNMKKIKFLTHYKYAVALQLRDNRNVTKIVVR